uniref:Uncharacterized protein n=1 Tax=Arundo donax TaxID=35708 RepID=A0A0A9B1H1_ARUDO
MMVVPIRCSPKVGGLAAAGGGARESGVHGGATRSPAAEP